MSEFFKVGDQVKITKHGQNASQYNRFIKGSSPSGIYAFPDWDTKTFVVCGEFKACSYDHSPEVYGAYPVSHNDIKVGYVYNTGLTNIKTPKFQINFRHNLEL